MSQADFVYTSASGPHARARSVSIFADETVAGSLREDAAVAGLELHECCPLTALAGEGITVLADVVLVDCPTADGAALAALARLDMRAAGSGARLVVSTTLAALDGVFACCDQSGARILVDPSRAERAVALGAVLSGGLPARVRELGQDDRLALMRLTEEVGRIAEQLDSLRSGEGILGDEPAFRFESPPRGYRAQGETQGTRRATRAPLPDPRLVRQIVRQRQLRARFFPAELFADPAWDMLLDLTAARAEHARVSVTSLCVASGVPPTTALRWIDQMTAEGLFERVRDDGDRRRVFVALSNRAAEAMAGYFAELGKTAQPLS